jgi:integrase
MYKGQRFTVACSVLGVPPTKEQSYQAANQWWDAKKAEIDSANRPAQRPRLPLEDIVGAWLGHPPDDVTNDVLEGGPDSSLPAEERAAAVIKIFLGDILAELTTGQPLPPRMAEMLGPARWQQIEAGIKGLRGEPSAAPDKTVAAWAGLWLQKQQQRVDAGQMTAARAANNRTCLEHFQTFLGPQSDVAGIDAERLDGFYFHCLAKVAARRRDKGQGWSVAYARDVFSVARAFVRWLVERDSIPPPKNIGSKSFEFGSPARAVTTWTPEEFKRTVAEAPGKLKLALLLMVNCGMTQVDVSDLLDSEVDWEAGRITRKRSKTADQENVPTVSYRLWPPTFKLLRQYRSGRERVLLTEGGEPYVRTRLNDQGKLVKADGIASNFVHLKRRLKLARPLKQLRKLGATLLGGHKDYGRFTSYFLGHSPRTVADRHYVVPPQQLFDKAVLWLGQQAGQIE